MPKFSALVSKLLVSSDGTEIYAECIGNHVKPHLVFVHGFTLSGSVFDKIFHDPRYQEEFYLVRYDMRGHGRSGKPNSIEGYSPQLYADDFKVVSENFELHAPTYVGWSLGGTPAADIVACLPEGALSGIVYLAAFFSTSFIPFYATPFAIQQVKIMTSSNSTPEDMRDATLRFSDGIFDWDSDCNPYVPSEARPRQLRRWDVQSTWLGYGMRQNVNHRAFVIMREQDPEPLFAVAKNGFPILVLHGTRDALVSAEKVIEGAKARFTDLTIALIEEGGTHAPFHDNPSEVMEHIRSFAKRTQKNSPASPRAILSSPRL